MNELLKGLLVVGGVNKVTSVSETASVEVSGRFTIERGNFKQEFSYWARTYEKFGVLAKVDDYEYETQSTMLGDLPIDNLDRSEERRVGKECRARRSRYHERRNKTTRRTWVKDERDK